MGGTLARVELLHNGLGYLVGYAEPGDDDEAGVWEDSECVRATAGVVSEEQNPAGGSLVAVR